MDSSSHKHVKINRVKEKTLNIFPVFNKSFYIIALCILIILFVGDLISNDTTYCSFENYIEEVGDENNTITSAIQYRNQIEKYFEDKNLDNIYYSDFVDDSDMLQAECMFNCSDDIGEYTLSFAFVNGKLSKLKLSVIMEEVPYNTYTSLNNLKVFNELLDKDIVKEIKR